MTSLLHFDEQIHGYKFRGKCQVWRVNLSWTPFESLHGTLVARQMKLHDLQQLLHYCPVASCFQCLDVEISCPLQSHHFCNCLSPSFGVNSVAENFRRTASARHEVFWFRSFLSLFVELRDLSCNRHHFQFTISWILRRCHTMMKSREIIYLFDLELWSPLENRLLSNWAFSQNRRTN